MASRAPISLIMLIVFFLAFVLLAPQGEAARILSNTPQKDGGTVNIGAVSIHGRGPVCNRSLYGNCLKPISEAPTPKCNVGERCSKNGIP